MRIPFLAPAKQEAGGLQSRFLHYLGVVSRGYGRFSVGRKGGGILWDGAQSELGLAGPHRHPEAEARQSSFKSPIFLTRTRWIGQPGNQITYYTKQVRVKKCWAPTLFESRMSAILGDWPSGVIGSRDEPFIRA